MSQFYQLQYLVDQTDIDNFSICDAQEIVIDTVNAIPVTLNPGSPYYQNGTIVFGSGGFSVLRQITIVTADDVSEDVEIIISGYSNGVYITEPVTIENGTDNITSDNYYDTIVSIVVQPIAQNPPTIITSAGSVVNGGFVGPILMNSLLPISNYLVTIQNGETIQDLDLQAEVLVTCGAGNGQNWLDYMLSLSSLGPVVPVSLKQNDTLEFPSYNITGFGLGKVMWFYITFVNEPAEQTIIIQFMQTGI